MKNSLTNILTKQGKSYWRYIVKAIVIMEAPSWIFTCILMLAIHHGWYKPNLNPSPFRDWSFLSMVLVGPIIESFILAGFAWILGKRFTNPTIISLISGIAWGALHAWGVPGRLEFSLAFIWSFYDFYIFTLGYLVWRPTSFWHGYFAAMLPHLAHDGQWKLLTLIC